MGELAMEGLGWIIYAVGFILVSLPLTWLFFDRRKLHPIRARYPLFSVILSIMFMVWAITVAVLQVLREMQLCLLSFWLAYLGTVVTFNLYMVRCFLLHANFSMTKKMVVDRKELRERLEIASTIKVSSLRTMHKVLRNFSTTLNKGFLKSSYLMKVMAAVTGCLMIAPLVFTFARDEIRQATVDNCQEHWGGAAGLLVAYAAVYLVLFIYFGIRIRGKVDAFNIKNELTLMAFPGILCVIPYYVLNNFATKVNQETAASSYILMTLTSYAFIITIMYPLYLSYRDAGSSVKIDVETLGVLKDAETCLKSTIGRRAFEDYLSTEFSVHHAYYWNDVEKLKIELRTASPRKMSSKFFQYIIDNTMALYEKYIQESSEMEINIGAKLRKPATEVYHMCSNQNLTYEVEELKTSTFEEATNQIVTPYFDAQRNVLNRMLKDSFRRFRKSTQYEDAKRQLYLGEEQERHLYEAGIVESYTDSYGSISARPGSTRMDPV